MSPDNDPIIEEWKQLSCDFDPEVEIEFLDEEDALEMVHDSEF
jgi:hypothetical protein